jgi:signal transduction histidine kinase
MVLEQARKAGLCITSRIPPRLPRVRADRRRIQQVLLNLLSNAIKFTPIGGNVTVLASLESSELTIAVRDSGIGMALDDIPKAFERFGQIDNTLARRYEGAGLGLPLARDLMKLHGGQLILESAPGSGTTASIKFPKDRLVWFGSLSAHDTGEIPISAGSHSMQVVA